MGEGLAEVSESVKEVSQLASAKDSFQMAR